MIGFISKIFGGSKSEKDVKTILPMVTKINQNFEAFQSLSNDELRNKTFEFRQRIREHLKDIDAEIAETNKRAEDLPFNDLVGHRLARRRWRTAKRERSAPGSAASQTP